MRLINEILRLVYDTILIQRDKLEDYNNKYEPQIIQEQDEYTLIYSRTNNHMVNSISAMIYLNYIDYLIKELVEYTSIYSQINELTLSFLSAMIYFNCTYKGSFSTEYRTDMFKFTITHRLVNTSFFTKILIYKDQYRYRTS